MARHEADMQSSASASATADFGPLLNLAIWTLAGSATVFLGLRLFAKHRGQRALWYDDYLLIAAWVSVIISCIMQTVDTTFGFGKEHRDIDAGILATTRLVSTAAGFFLILAAAWSKTSFALTLLRISEGWPKKLVLFVIWTTNIAIGVSAITQWAQCWPLARLWEGEGVEGQCLPLGLINGYNMFVSGYSGLMDISLALLPWVIVRPFDNLAPSGSTRRKEKFGIVVAMGMAVFAGLTSLLKIYAIYHMIQPHASAERVVAVMILGTAEGAITIMAVSIPALSTFLRKERGPVEIADLSLKSIV